MTQVLLVALGILIGALVTAVIALLLRQRHAAALGEARSRATLLDEQAQRQASEIAEVRGEMLEVDRAREAAERLTATLQEQLRAREQQFAEQADLLEQAKSKLTDAFKALAADALRLNNEQFLPLAKSSLEPLLKEHQGDVEKRQQAIDAMVKPIKELLDKHNTAVGALETKRETAYATLDQKIAQIAAAHDKLGAETNRLVTALRKPDVRGRWGEMQLRNVVELAGMTRHCDFVEQATVHSEDGPSRPDMIVRMPGGGVLVVDSKVALQAYLDALQPDADRDACLRNHARQTAQHVRKLSSQRYWEQFERTPKVVVMFVPLESALAAALDVEPELQAEAMRGRVLIATPISLLGLLHTVAFGWQQEAVARNSQQIQSLGKELYERLSKFLGDLDDVGKRLASAGRAYTSAIASLEGRLLQTARKLNDLRGDGDAVIESPQRHEFDVRQIAAAELPQTSQADDDESQAQARRIAAEPPLIDLMKLDTEDALDARR